MLVDEFHRGLSGLHSVVALFLETLRDGVGGGYNRAETPETPALRFEVLDLERGVLRVALVWFAMGTGILEYRLPRVVVLLVKLLCRDFEAPLNGVDVPNSLLCLLRSTTDEAGELPGVSANVLLATDLCSERIVDTESRSCGALPIFNCSKAKSMPFNRASTSAHRRCISDCNLRISPLTVNLV
jgi:hypothetical protein